MDSLRRVSEVQLTIGRYGAPQPVSRSWQCAYCKLTTLEDLVTPTLVLVPYLGQ